MPAPDPNLAFAFGLPPQKAIEYFRSKGYAISWNWHDVWEESQARAFTVARVLRTDVLQDIRNAVDRALANGQTLRQFARELTPILQAKGWWGKQIIVDSAGGAEAVQLGSPHRLKTIYRTNLQTAFMAGRYASLIQSSKRFPYWQYVAVLDAKTRPSHAALHGKVVRFDDPFWDSFFPPLGFNCRCRVRPLSQAEVDRKGLSVFDSNGKLSTEDVVAGTDKRTGEQRIAEVAGVRITGPDGRDRIVKTDPGWNYNPGAEWLKPFTPPPLDTLPQTFPRGLSAPAVLPPTPFSPQRLLATGLAEVEYVKRFLAEFGAGLGRGVVWRDLAGDAVAIDETLFQDGAGNWKVTKGGREVYLLALADTIKSPDEIWLRWEQSRATGDWLLKRRYLKSFAISNTEFGVVAFEWGQDGWSGSTAFTLTRPTEAGRLAYFEKQRDGFLKYRR